MNGVLDKVASNAFTLFAAAKGYRFVEVKTEKQYADIDQLYGKDGFSFPPHLREKVRSYKTGTINFIAYHRNVPVGTVRLGNPKINNRPFELYGVDEAGEHYEIQSLFVKKDYRDGTHFVMLGLFRAMYAYSVNHSIASWSSCGMNNIYMTIRRYCKKIELQDIDFQNISHPLTRYLYANRIIDTYFTMDVSSFEPWDILKKFVKQLVRRMEMPEFLKIKKPLYAGINYGSK